MSDEFLLALTALLEVCKEHRHELPAQVWEYVYRAIEVQNKEEE